MAVRHQMDRELGACVEVPVQRIPFDVPRHASYLGDPVREAGDALTKVGLLSRAEGTYVFPGTTNPVPGYHYSLTDEGKKYERTIQGLTGNVSFCGGKPELVDLYIPAHPPTQVGGATPISFTWKLVNAPQWMSDPEITKVFASDVRLGTRPGDMVLTLRNDGWSAAR